MEWNSPYDIMAASPIKALAFEGNNSQDGGVQSFRIHYQSVNGHIKELRYDGILAGWNNATWAAFFPHKVDKHPLLRSI
jgi:hypothetical protein